MGRLSETCDHTDAIPEGVDADDSAIGTKACIIKNKKSKNTLT